MASHNKPGQATTPKFTAEMRDRQARNKDPYTGGPVRTSSPNEEGSSSSSARKQPKVIAAADDSYESGQRRRWAAIVLGSPELIMMHALSRGDSVACTKHYFTKVLCGYDEPPRVLEKRAAGGRKEKEKKPLSKINYKPITGAYEM